MPNSIRQLGLASHKIIASIPKYLPTHHKDYSETECE